jgi:peptidyl-prolyl cis-trans isomerase SurA
MAKKTTRYISTFRSRDSGRIGLFLIVICRMSLRPMLNKNLNLAIKKIAILSGLLALLAISFTVQAQSGTLDRIVVTVNGEPITETEIQVRMKVQIYETVQSGGKPLSADVARNQAIEGAISFLVQRQFARTINLSVTSSEVTQRLNVLSEQRGQSPEELIRQVEAFGLARADVDSFLFEILLNDKLTQRVLLPRVRIREEEIDRYIGANSEEFAEVDEYNLNFIVISNPPVVTAEHRQLLLQVTREIEYELKRGTNFNEIARAARRIDGIDAGELGWVRSQDIAPELASAISQVPTNTSIGPIESDGTTFFALVRGHRENSGFTSQSIQQFHLARFVMHAGNEAGAEVIVEQLEELRQNIVDGADFGALAKLYSHDSDSRKNGGDIGWVSEDNLPLEYLRPLQNMDVGDISPVQRIQNSAYILQLRGVKLADVEEQKRSAVRRFLRNNKLRNEHAKWVDDLRASAKIVYRKNF